MSIQNEIKQGLQMPASKAVQGSRHAGSKAASSDAPKPHLISVKSCHMDFLQKVHVCVGFAGF
jgi:hypothetical protein